MTTIQEFVENNVICNMSSLVATIATVCGTLSELSQEMEDLAGKAFELCTPIDDFEEAARRAGWARFNDVVSSFFANAETGERFFGDDWQTLCAEFYIDAEPYQKEVLEFWSVSERFGKLLEAQSEKIDFDFAGHIIWARTTSGQVIYADHVVEECYRTAQAEYEALIKD